jgi:hypothetical protein
VLPLEGVALAAPWLEVVTASASVVTAVSLVFGIVGARVALHQLAEAKLARQWDFIANAVRQWDDERMEDARAQALKYNPVRLRELVAALYGARGARSPELAVLLRVPDYFEFLAFAADAGRISVDFVWRMFGGPAALYWELWRDAIGYLRETTGDPNLFIEFENLVLRFPSRPGE